MPLLTVMNASVAGLAAAVPSTTLTMDDLRAMVGDNAERITKSSGIKQRRVVPTNNTICASDLCQAAAEKLLSILGWERSSISALIMVTQTPDYRLPATACVVQSRLGLSNTCAAFDVGLGCSGYVYGLWLASSLVAAGGLDRVLLLVGDTITRHLGPDDRSVVPLFGDAGSATAIESRPHSVPSFFDLGTDGSGLNSLLIPAGGQRMPSNSTSTLRTLQSDGNVRGAEDLYMNGADIFSFALREVPKTIKAVVEASGWGMENVSQFILHQANQTLVKSIARKVGIPDSKLPINLDRFGNTSGASIPLAMVTELRAILLHEAQNLVVSGFGVGLSFGSAAISVRNLIVPELVVLNSPSA